MTDDEIIDAIDGLMAYDHGSTDSGIHDERLRARVIAWLHANPTDTERVLRRYVLELLAEGSPYGVEDVAGLFKWLADSMEYDL
jgi:hypothetical protein